MQIFTRAKDLHHYLTEKRKLGNTIGFVPTMGALHAGHIYLVETSKNACDVCVVSIFVNPTQFNAQADFDKYPITTDADIAILTEAKCDVLYLPSVQEVYPDGVEKLTKYDLGALETMLEGAFRPGHFQGVCNVLDRLFTLVQPSKVFMGLKDLQQCAVVSKLLEITKSPIELVACPTHREDSGLARSSRNTRLSADALVLAPKIFGCLSYIKKQYKHGNFEQHVAYCNELLGADFKTEYISLLDIDNWTLLDDYKTNGKMAVLIATWLDGVRLIDNMIITE